MEKSIEDFLTDVYYWLIKPLNRCVEDNHYLLKDSGNMEMLKESVKGFLTGRIIQGEGKNIEDLPEGFLDKAVDQYIANMD